MMENGRTLIQEWEPIKINQELKKKQKMSLKLKSIRL